MHANPASADLYERLGITQDANQEEIRAAFKAMRKELHPDSRPDSLRSHFDQLMKNVNEAHQTLTDARARAKYDAKRGAAAQGQQQRDAAREESRRQEEAQRRADQQRREYEAEERRRRDEAERRAEEDAQAHDDEEWWWSDDEDDEPARRDPPGEPAPAATAGGSVMEKIPGPVHRVAIYTAGSWAWLAACFMLWQLPFVGPLVAIVGGLGIPALIGFVLLKTAFALPAIQKIVGFVVPAGGRFTAVWYARRVLESAVLAPILFFVASIFSGVYLLASMGALVYVGLWVAEFVRWRGRRQEV